MAEIFNGRMSGPQLVVEAGTGPFKMVSTCGDGYAY